MKPTHPIPPSINLRAGLAVALLTLAAFAGPARADEPLFGYARNAETLAAGHVDLYRISPAGRL